MHRKTARSLCCPAVLTLLAGCATVEPQGDYARVARHVAEATGHDRVYDPQRDEYVGAMVEEMLRDGISVGEAVDVCLLNNPELQAAFMTVGMARADVVQAGMLSNPSLGIAVQFPAGGGLANLEAGLAHNIADLWQMPPRRRAAERSLDQTILNLARRSARLAADAKVAYYEAVGADERLRIARENLEVAHNLLELALMRQQAGATNELDVNLSRSLALDGELEVGASQLRASEARRALATLLGLTADANALVLLDPLPEVPLTIPDAPRLLELAQARRLDIRSADQAVGAAEARLREEYRRVFPRINFGLALERGERGRSEGGRDLLADTARASIANGRLTAPGIQPRSERRRHTDFIIGPSLSVELPVFDQNQAQIAKAQYAYEQARKTLEALKRAATHEVRAAVDRASTAWSLARLYRDRSIPLAESNLELSREAYRVGSVSFLSVLEAQRFFLKTRTGYVEAAQTAATAIPELERTIGLPFAAIIAELDAHPASGLGTKKETQP